MKEEFDAIIKSEDLKEISIGLVESILDGQIGDELLSEIPTLRHTSPSLARFTFLSPNSKLEIEITTVRAPLMRNVVRYP